MIQQCPNRDIIDWLAHDTDLLENLYHKAAAYLYSVCAPTFVPSH